jgi:cysteine desulfurase
MPQPIYQKRVATLFAGAKPSFRLWPLQGKTTRSCVVLQHAALCVNIRLESMTPPLPIYLDNHATTRCDPRALEAMLPYFSDIYGNAASRHHSYGAQAADAVEMAREQIAELIGASPKEIIFTSGATESDNLAIKGAAALLRRHGDHLITCQTEHHAVLDVGKRLQREGWNVTFLPVDDQGRITPVQVAAAFTPKTVLVSLMLANNEIGVVHPLAEIGRLCKERGILLHTDAAQAVGKIPVDVETLRVDLLSLSAHKIYGPKGVGALYVRRRDPAVRLEPLFDGGGHERGFRPGTLPVPLIVSFGAACALARAEMPAESARVRRLRDRLLDGLKTNIPDTVLNGPSLDERDRLPGNLNVSFPHVHGEALLMALNSLAVSSGSACTSASVEPSYVLRALGIPDDLAHASLRFGIGRYNTEEEIDFAIAEVAAAVHKLRAISPSFQLAASEALHES